MVASVRWPPIPEWTTWALRAINAPMIAIATEADRLRHIEKTAVASVRNFACNVE